MTLSYPIKTIKYGTITMLIDKNSLPLIESLPTNSKGKRLTVSYYKNNIAQEPTITDKGIFTGSFYVFTYNKKAIHRLITNCPDDMVVDHINHNTLDNTLANLKVCTAKQNKQNSLKAYTDTRTLSRQQIKQILLNPQNLTYRQLAAKYNVSNCLISDIKRGKVYTDVEPKIPRTTNKNRKQLPLFLKQQFKKQLLDPNRTVSVRQLAKNYGIPSSSAFLIKAGKKWKNVVV